MTNKEILKGLKYRIDSLEKAKKCYEEEGSLAVLVQETEGRIDELESVYNWIKSNQGE